MNRFVDSSCYVAIPSAVNVLTCGQFNSPQVERLTRILGVTLPVGKSNAFTFRSFSSNSSLEEAEAAWKKRASKEIGGGDPVESLTNISPEVRP